MFALTYSRLRAPRAAKSRRRVPLYVESLEHREVPYAAVVNVIADAPFAGLIPITQAGQPSALNLAQADSSQLSAVTGTYPSFLTGGNASPAVPATQSGLATRQAAILQAPLTMLTTSTTSASALASLTPYEPLRPLLPRTSAVEAIMNPLAGPAVDQGAFVVGTEETLEEGYMSDVPGSASLGERQPAVAPPNPTPSAPEAKADDQKPAEQAYEVALAEASWYDVLPLLPLVSPEALTIACAECAAA